MSVYFLCLFIPLCCSLISTKRANFLLVLFFVFIVVISGYRYVGTDVPAYKIYFESIDAYSLSFPLYEKGYFVLNKIISFFTNDFQYVLIVTALITLIPIYTTIKKYSINPFLSLFYFISFYFYFNSFNLVRQYLVVSFLFYSVKFIFEKRLIPFVLTVLVASLFHMTALFFIPFYWLCRIKYRSFTYLILMIASVCISFLTPTLIRIIAKLVPKVASYINYDVQGASANFTIIFTFCAFVVAILLKEKIEKIEKNSIIYINFVFFAFCLSLLSINNIIFFRLASYFYIFIILLLPLLFYSLDKKLKPITYFLSSLLLIMYYYRQLFNNNAGVYPYDYSERIYRGYLIITFIVFIFLGVKFLFGKKNNRQNLCGKLIKK
ncbi:EpsG family protein [Vagococcus fluvialis]|uniref:EpsG family protein n=1 Tax=Vagococcus fluvialis TaxID=2738 RepID=UPI00288E80FE|nr:EpsG family protein [Vagococcus fluvialis]MDT2747772.1 EpsG family protein [Vagococcus fluvialis]